ncbi:MAG: DUF3817 domain-containing protein [Salibacteraceae bacterium]
MENEKITRAKTTILVGHIEGFSYLALLLIAMPLKYMFDMPIWVRIVGTLHGFLFVAYIYFLIDSWARLKWKFLTPVILFIMSLIPFGTFIQKKVIAYFNN